MKKPRVDRGPKLNKAMAQPQTMMTNGVRQPDAEKATLRSLVVTDIGISPAAHESAGSAFHSINAFAWKSQPTERGKCASHCSVAIRRHRTRRIDSPLGWRPRRADAMFVLLVLRIIAFSGMSPTGRGAGGWVRSKELALSK
jgi:hypothetical protein